MAAVAPKLLETLHEVCMIGGGVIGSTLLAHAVYKDKEGPGWVAIGSALGGVLGVGVGVLTVIWVPAMVVGIPWIVAAAYNNKKKEAELR